MKKILLLLLIIVFTIGSVYALVHYIKMDGFLFAWTLNFLLMFFIVFFTTALKSPLTSPYYHQKQWENKGKLYELFGVNLYRKLLVWIGWEKVTRKANPIGKNTEALTNLQYQTKKSELDHVIILIIIFGFNLFVAFKFGILKSLWLLISNILFHFYPIILQRYNRPRIERAIALSKRR
jgi:hypothetical protein